MTTPLILAGQTLYLRGGTYAGDVTSNMAGTYRNCLNPAETITLAAGGSLPMTGWTVAAPIGAAAPLISSTFPTFGAFLVTP